MTGVTKQQERVKEKRFSFILFYTCLYIEDMIAGLSIANTSKALVLKLRAYKKSIEDPKSDL